MHAHKYIQIPAHTSTRCKPFYISHKTKSCLEYTVGIHSTALAWFKSYVYDRFQKVFVNNMQSDPVKRSCGVPQGSVLGPVLFTLYTTPLASIINRHNLNHHFYTDDTQLLASGRHPYYSTHKKSNCYSDINNWTAQNKLQLNSEKTEAMLIGTRQKLSSISANTLQLDIPLSDSVKSLGVLLNSTLSMENFISQTAKSCYYQLRRITSVRNCLSTEATVVTSLFLSRLDYCNSLLSGLPASPVQSLSRIQNCTAPHTERKKKKTKKT